MLASVAKSPPTAGAGDGDVSLVIMLDLETEVEMKLPGRFRVSPQIAGAIKVVSGVQTLQVKAGLRASRYRCSASDVLRASLPWAQMTL
jgi:hypothetical protein